MEFLSQCRTLAKSYFGIKTLHSAQEDVLNLLIKHAYVLATMPTGSGKTLLYAIPSLIFNEGPVLVISPLIALMRDQVRRMKSAHISSVLFTSDQSEEERSQSYIDLWSENTKIIFVSPERFALSSFQQKLERIRPSMVVIDEAHCVVSWGHQFRPEYSEIGNRLAALNPPRILAITATASAHTRNEMIQKIFPTTAKTVEFISKPISSNINIKAKRMFSFEEQKKFLIETLKNTHSHKSIIYFSTRKQCEEFAMLLKHKNLHTIAYHAGLSKEKRLSVEQYIHNTQKKIVICATTAFGLGVDIPDVTLVVVYGFPGNIEEFLQMVGRAGRSGQPAEGVLIWTGSDPVKRNLQFKTYFPTKTDFINQCQKINALLPEQEGESCFASLEKIKKYLFSDSYSKLNERHLEGLLGALRACHMTEDLLQNEDYYEIKLSKQTNLLQLASQLPSSPTKRQKVFEAIKNLISDKLYEKNALQTIIPVNQLLSSTSLSLNSCEEVFKYYTTQKLISFVKIDFNQKQVGVVLKNGIKMLETYLPHYIKLRQNFFSSLQEVRKLAEAPHCRLQSSFKYFKIPKMDKTSQYCLQCDLCEKYERVS